MRRDLPSQCLAGLRGHCPAQQRQPGCRAATRDPRRRQPTDQGTRGASGCGLVRQDGRGIKLTDAGSRLRDASFDAFDRLRTVCAELSRDVSEAPFVLGCSGSLLARWFIPRLGRLKADLPELRLHLSAGEGDWTPAPRTGCLAGVCRAAVACGHAGSCVGPGAHRAGGEPAFRGFRALAQRAGKALLDEALLDTTSRPQAWPTWAEQQGLDPAALRFGQAFEHLYYLLEAAVAGLGWPSLRNRWWRMTYGPGG